MVRIALVAFLSVLFVPPATAGQPVGARVLVIAHDDVDPRIAQVRSAVTFWNRTLDELGLPAILGDPEVSVSPPAIRDLENHAWRLSRSAGRLARGTVGPDPPAVLAGLDHEIVVLLSSQTALMPFAWPLPEPPRHFIAITADGPMDEGTTMDVIVHELGHALGLEHDPADPSALMCQPCGEPPAGEHGHPAGARRALTPKERARLIELYGSEHRHR